MRIRGINMKAMIAHSYEIYLEIGRQHNQPEGNRLGFLSEYIFGFTTYDSEMDGLFAVKAIDVCNAITERQTFDYIKDRSNYAWFLAMCHMPFFEPRICWGTSIRGAFWYANNDGFIEYDTCGIWIGDDQVTEKMLFSSDEWNDFIRAIVEFASGKEPI